MIGSSTISAINIAIAVESMPPDRNTPSGTSAMRRIRIDSSRRAPNSSMRLASDASVTGGHGSSDQYCDTLIAPSLQRSTWPGSSLRTPSNKVCSPEGAWLER